MKPSDEKPFTTQHAFTAWDTPGPSLASHFAAEARRPHLPDQHCAPHLDTLEWMAFVRYGSGLMPL